MATLNIGLKVNRAITGATTVNANAVAIVTYIATTHNVPMNSNGAWNDITNQQIPNAGIGTIANTIGQHCNRVFGPAASIPASFTTTAPWSSYNSIGGTHGKSTMTITWTLQSGVELINTQ